MQGVATDEYFYFHHKPKSLLLKFHANGITIWHPRIMQESTSFVVVASNFIMADKTLNALEHVFSLPDPTVAPC
jgi:hypothetical protein